MKKLFTIAFFILALQATAQKHHTNEDPRFKGLDTALIRVLKTWHVAGFAVAVIEKNKVIYIKGFGSRNTENELPVTPNTLFAIGSCTKAFTASLIGGLQQQGKLDIDKPVTNYLPSLKFYNDAMNNTITLRDMMSHRTGLPRHDLSWYLFPTTSRDSLMQRIQYQEPTATVRQTWQYNNFMFAAQGAVIEKISGKTWEDNIKEKFFIPLGMSRSDLNIDELEKSDDIATGYEVKGDSLIKKMNYYHIRSMAPAGAINSSANDMAKWVITWINNGRFEGKEIIPATFRDQAISSQTIITAALPTKEQPELYFATYGFGWMLSSYKGHYRVEHGGNIDGFSASTCFFPTDSIGIVVLTNQNNSVVPSIIRNLVSDRMLGKKYFDWNSDMKKAADKGKADATKMKKEKVADVKNAPPTHPYSNYEGIYTNLGYGTLRVYYKNDSLFARATDRTFWMKHTKYDFFNVYEEDPQNGVDTTDEALQVQFLMNPAGDIDSFGALLEAGLKPIVFAKGVEAKTVTAGELEKYAGAYELAGITATVSVRGSTLYISIPGQPDYEMVPIGNGKFSVKVLNGYYAQFGPLSAEKITELTFIQPNGSFTAKKK